jgi:hypothetical protein
MRGLHAYILGGGEPKFVQSQELAAIESKKFGLGRVFAAKIV